MKSVIFLLALLSKLWGCIQVVKISVLVNIPLSLLYILTQIWFAFHPLFSFLVFRFTSFTFRLLYFLLPIFMQGFKGLHTTVSLEFTFKEFEIYLTYSLLQQLFATRSNKTNKSSDWCAQLFGASLRAPTGSR